MRSVSVRLSDLEKITIPIGFVGENLFTEVNIDCMKVFGDHPTAIPSLAVTTPEGDSYPGLVERDGDIVKWTICDSDLAYKGSGEIQLAFTVDDEMIGKSYTARTKILRSIEPSGQAPTPIANWLIEAGTTLAEVQQALIDIPAEIAEGLANLIDDTAGAGVTDKVWSADKNTSELAKKYQKPNSGIPASDIAEGVIPDISGKIDSTEKGAVNGVATLGGDGKVPSAQLPSYVDDVVEYASLSAFPVTGESGKIYVALDTNLTYRWSGSAYVEISPSLALGETESTAYRGDRGKVAYDHAVAKGSAFASGFYKITTNAEGHVTAVSAVQKSDITALGICGEEVATTAETQAIIDAWEVSA